MSIRENLSNDPLGFGAAPLGNMFRNVPDEEAEATVDAAWQQGTRYFDTAPFYGGGLSERDARFSPSRAISNVCWVKIKHRRTRFCR